MSILFEKFKSLNIDYNLICLEQQENKLQYFCYPVNAIPIGYEQTIMYCFIEPYGDMVFAVNPDPATDKFVYPLAKTFEDFISLVLACGSPNPAEQVIWMSKEKFESFVQEEAEARTDEHKDVLVALEKEMGLAPMENPYEYVKTVQAGFDESLIEYSDEYYEVLGLTDRQLDIEFPARPICYETEIEVCISHE